MPRDGVESRVRVPVRRLAAELVVAAVLGDPGVGRLAHRGDGGLAARVVAAEGDGGADGRDDAGLERSGWWVVGVRKRKKEGRG